MANVRTSNVPSVPFAASALEGVYRKRATLSDTENLAVGAFGGVLETCIQSTSMGFANDLVSSDRWKGLVGASDLVVFLTSRDPENTPIGTRIV